MGKLIDCLFQLVQIIFLALFSASLESTIFCIVHYNIHWKLKTLNMANTSNIYQLFLLSVSFILHFFVSTIVYLRALMTEYFKLKGFAIHQQNFYLLVSGLNIKLCMFVDCNNMLFKINCVNCEYVGNDWTAIWTYLFRSHFNPNFF